MKKQDKVNNKNIGNAGEDAAAAYLESNGYLALYRNYRTKTGEIDIIAKKNGIIHIVEVKTSNHGSPIMPEENYTKAKARQVFRMAELFAAKENIMDAPMQIDLIAVRIKDDHSVDSLHYYENVIVGD